MPETEVRFYQVEPGDVPVLDWLRELRRKDQKAFAKCVVRIERALRRKERYEANPDAHTFEGET